jgi:hypothetical protein
MNQEYVLASNGDFISSAFISPGFTGIEVITPGMISGGQQSERFKTKRREDRL